MLKMNKVNYEMFNLPSSFTLSFTLNHQVGRQVIYSLCEQMKELSLSESLRSELEHILLTSGLVYARLCHMAQQS